MSGLKSKPITGPTKDFLKDLPGFRPIRQINSDDKIHDTDALLRRPSTSPNVQLTFEEELALLERESGDDLVHNSLGSFHTSTDRAHFLQSNISGGKYTVPRDSSDNCHVVRDNPGGTTPRVATPLRDSGISSATTDAVSPSAVLGSKSTNTFQWDNRMSQLQPLASVDVEMNDLEVKPPLVQVNGSIGRLQVEDEPKPGTSRRQLHAKTRLRTEMSFYGTTDPRILRSELLAAVEHNKSDKVRNILTAGIDPNSVCDEKGRWPLHIACLLGLSAITKLLLEHGAQKDQPDTALERTPLLYAAATSKEVVQVLLGHRADIHARNKFSATALHYAAGAGQADCCRILASAGIDVNGRDGQKMTPLLMAARVDDIWSIDVLLEYGGDIHATDAYGKNALHHAAETCEGMESDIGKMGATFRKLAKAGISINAIDHDGKTALYYAIQTGSEDAVMILFELGAELMDGMSLLTMAKKFPHIIPPFLDKCVSSNIDNCDPDSKQFYIQFDYTVLTLFPKDIPHDKLLSMQNREEKESILQEMGVLHGLTRCKDASILSHPVCESLLRLKWKKVKWYLYLDMLLFAVFLAFLTAVIFMEYESDNPQIIEDYDNVTLNPNPAESSSSSSEKGTSTSSHATVHERYCMDSPRHIVVWSILWILTTGIGIRELIQLIQAPLRYLVQLDNILEMALVSSVAFLSFAECGVNSFFTSGRDHFAAVCLIVGWTIQVTLYGKIPVFGVYIRMFAAVSQNILKCMFTYLGLLFAFSLTLHFLFRTQKDFDSVGYTFLKTFAMMIGEVDLARTFIDSRLKNAVIVPFTSHIVVVLFIVFISIILSSLFIALAVCDIHSMQREGEHMQLVQQVKVASHLEDALQKRSLLYPQFGMQDSRSLHQRKGVIFPNLKDHGKLSKDAIQIVMTQHSRRLDSGTRSGMVQQAPSTIHGNGKTTYDISTDDLLQKLRQGMEKYSDEADKRITQMSKDLRAQLGSTSLAREVLLIKSQLEDMNKCLRELSVVVKTLADNTFQESFPSRKQALRGTRTRALYHTSTQQSSSPDEMMGTITTPDGEQSTETSKLPSPQTSDHHSPPPVLTT